MSIETLWEKAVDFHGHSCPSLALGVVASEIVLEEFGKRAKDEELVCIVENDACGVDAIQVILGCTFGKGNLIHRDYGKAVYTFFNRRTEKAIRLSRKLDAFHREPEAQNKNRELFEKVQKGNAATKKEVEEYKKKRQIQINQILKSGRKIFNIREINIPPPEKARIFESIICDHCKEPTMVTRIKQIDNKYLCIPCYEEIGT